MCKIGRIKPAVSILAAGALIFLYGTIFHFSAQEGAASSSLSLRVSTACVEFVNSLRGGDWSGATVHSYALLIEGFVRKAAHFAEYALMGSLIYLTIRPWWERSRMFWLTVTVWLTLSAAADEFHQFFVADRNASPFDVLLDLCGGLCGALVLTLLEKLFLNCCGDGRRVRNRKKTAEITDKNRK